MKKTTDNSEWNLFSLNKLLLIMKITTILMVLGLVNIYAVGYSQQEKITIHKENVSIRDIFSYIEKESGYKFLYTDDYSGFDKLVTLNADQKSISSILNDVFNNTGTGYKLLDNKLIVVVPVAYLQQQKVTGTVTDGGTNEPLPGVNILIEGTNTGTITDINGKYSIDIPSSTSVLVFSFVGYNSESIQVADKTTIDVALVPDVTKLGEVIVVGYSTQKTATLTGSISEVKGKEFVKSPQANVSNSLAGRVSGVIANNRSGEPGYDGSNFYIRGKSTTGNNDVLIVVDGVPGQIGGLDRIDPNDIASITILKDASAAVYGSRAANGAILITTKRGTTGKPQLSYSFNQGFSSPTRLPEMADAATYATIRNEIQYYNNKAGGMNQVYSDAQIQKFGDGSDPINYPNTDWQKETLKKVALQSQHSLSFAGGTEDVKYYASLGTLHQDGIYKKGATKYNQYNVRSNIDANITKRLKVSLNISGRQEDRQYPINSAGTIFRSIYRAYPTAVATYPNGFPSEGIEKLNPVVMATDMGGTVQNPKYVLNGNLKARYFIPYIEGLSLEGMLSTDKSFDFNKKFNIPYTLYSYDKTTETYNKSVTGGSGGKAKLEESQENISLVTSNIKLDYTKHIGKNNINVFVIYEQSTWKNEKLGATRLNYPSSETPELSQGGSAASDIDNSGSSSKFTRKSYIGKLGYDYDEKYLLETQFRVDGSSIFPDGNRYGFFPSVSAGWRISEEEWFKNNISFIDNLKLRASYGVLGNDNVNPFQYYNNYSFSNNYIIGSNISPGINLVKLANPDITWESSKKLDIGFNASVLNNFTIEFVYFKQQRSDILAYRNASIPGTSGIVNPYKENGVEPLVPSENIGKVDNTGFESTIGYTKQGNFTYNISANVTYAKSEIINIDEAPGTLDYQKETGGPLGTQLLYNVIGIFRTQGDLDKYPHFSTTQLGDLIYEDRSKDGNIDANDRYRTEYGNIPQITYGINMGAAWKNIDISLLFSGQARVRNYVLSESGTIGNYYSSWADNRWSPNNVNGSHPRVDERASASVNGGQYKNNFWLDNSAFLRLKNLSIGYTLPENIISRLKLSKIRIYANAFNLFTITKVKDYDPEGDSESGQFYPQQRIYNLGLNINF